MQYTSTSARIALFLTFAAGTVNVACSSSETSSSTSPPSPSPSTNQETEDDAGAESGTPASNDPPEAGTPSGKDAGGDTSSDKDADVEPTVPSSLSIQGQARAVSCTQPIGGEASKETDCTIAIDSFTSVPALSGSLADAVIFRAENKSPPDTGWTSGLDVQKPAFPSKCLQTLVLDKSTNSDGMLHAHVYGKPDGVACGLSTNPTTSTFSGGLNASLTGTWRATGDRVPATLTLQFK